MLQAWEPSFWQRAGVAVGQALDQAIKGDYAEETTLVGTAAQIGVIGDRALTDKGHMCCDGSWQTHRFFPYAPACRCGDLRA